MKFAIFELILLCAGFFVASLSGCQAQSSPVTNTGGSFSSLMTRGPKTVTIAAEKSARDLQMTDIVSHSTKTNGTVTAKTKKGEAVTIDIEQAGENQSRVTIRIIPTDEEIVMARIVRTRSRS